MPKGKGLNLNRTKKSTPLRKISVPRPGTDDRFRAEDDLRTIRRAGEITGDKKRMGNVKKLAAHESQSLQKIAKNK